MFRYGVDYYPEQWPEERWPEDARLMQEAGMNLVRLAEFAWSRLEPRGGSYDFAWLDRAIDVLAARDIDVILGTPTASPPPWLMAAHPDLFLVWPDGVRATYGSRRPYCPSHPVYRDYAVRITQAMAEHYRDHPRVIGWQIDNEFGDACYCDLCRAAYQAWLENKYEALEAVNAAWGTDFWSHRYTEWSQIPLPMLTTRVPLGTNWGVVANPGLALDFARFVSDTYVDFQAQQLSILRQTCPKHFVTHNFMGFTYDKLNYFDLAKPLDLVSWDSYPRAFWRAEAKMPGAEIALGHAAMRGLKNRNFWLIEGQSGRAGWHIMGSVPRPGELRLWSYQAIAHGADAVVFFRWRSGRFGTEQLWQGVLDHDAVPRRRYQEIKQMGQELRRIGDRVVGSEVRAEAAIILSYDSRFALDMQPNSSSFSYTRHVTDYYTALHNRSIPTAITSPDADLTPYRLVVVPALYVTDEATADSLGNYVERGGILVITARSGVKDSHNAVVDMPLPGLLARLCGVEVEDVDVLLAEDTRAVRFDLPQASDDCAAGILCEVLQLEGAQALAYYCEDFYAGRPAITVNSYGRGKAMYVGTLGTAALVQRVIDQAINWAGVKPVQEAPSGVEITARWEGDRQLLFVLNHAAESQHVVLNSPYVDLLTESRQSGRVCVPPYGVLVLSPVEDASG